MRVAWKAALGGLILGAISCWVAAQEVELEALLDDLTGETAAAEAAGVPAEPSGVTEAPSTEALAPEAAEAEGETGPVIQEVPVVEVPAELAEELFPEEAGKEAVEAGGEEAEAVPVEVAPEAAAPTGGPAVVPEKEAAATVPEELELEELLGETEAAAPAAGPAAPPAEAEEGPKEAGEAPPEEGAVEAAAPAAPAAPAPTLEEAKLLAAQEEVRRQADEKAGLEARDRGNIALERGEYEKALEYFEDALRKLRERPLIRRDLESARWGAAEADYRIALGLYRERETRMDLEKIREARRRLERALERAPDHRPAAALLPRVKEHEKRLEELAGLPVPPAERPDVLEKKKNVEELLEEGKQFFEIEDYRAAEAIFTRVLEIDEYNVTAMRFLKKIEERRFQIATREREASVAKAMRTVRETWTPPVIEEVKLPEAVTARAAVETVTQAQRLQEKMARIMIPAIEFRQANIHDVVNFLVEASIKGDPEGVGVNIVLHLGPPGAEAAPAPAAPAPGPPAAAEVPFAEEFPEFAEAAPPAAAPGIPTITLNLRRISLLDALKIITEVAGLRYRIEGSTVIITPAGYAAGPIVTRMYPVQPSIFDVIIEREEAERERGEFIEMGARTTIKHGDVEEFFKKLGVPFPVGSSITYNRAMSKLIVANTPENLDIFERILAQLNVVPQQVEIEARFIEVSQSDLEELGLEWILTDHYEIAQREGPGPITTREHVRANADPHGVTKGLRFLSFDQNTAAISPASAVTRGISQATLGGILSISTVLTNPEVTMILHALSQRGGADLLSAPRVTTRSGVNAQIKVVREIIYPTEFEVTQPTIAASSVSTVTGPAGAAAGGLVTPPTVTPGSFETREVGVILNVTPTVGPDGYTIDLTLAPEVAELVDWIQYGSSMSAGGQDFTFNVPQPVFSSRNATTSIVIWDGQTIVMGGLIREELVRVDDKIPLLGDIPLVGRLFRTRGEHSQKRNLLIFVTARLVDPAGKPVHGAGALAMPGLAPTSVETATP